MRLASKDFVRAVVTDPAIWPHLAEDSHDPANYQPADTVYFRHEDFGFMQFDKTGTHWYQVHIAMKRGATGVAAFVRGCMAEMRQRGAKRFMAMIAASNRSAIVLAYRCGYTWVGRLDGALLKQGKLVDMVILEAT